jgi:hypothetical protein
MDLHSEPLTHRKSGERFVCRELLANANSASFAVDAEPLDAAEVGVGIAYWCKIVGGSNGYCCGYRTQQMFLVDDRRAQHGTTVR